MADFIVLRFADLPTEPVEWISVDQFGAQQGPIEHGDLQAFAAAATGKRVIALVPGTDVLRTSLDIPIRNHARLMQAIPFAMEDQLADGIEELHFAVGRRDDQQRTPVAVVQHLKMKAWLEQIRSLELDLSGVYADTDALGDMPNTTILLVEARRAILRDADGQTAATEVGSIDTLLDVWLASHLHTDGDELPPPINLFVYLTPECETMLQPVIDRIRSRVETLESKIVPDGGLPRMATHSIAAPGINLLQGAYASRSTFGVYWPLWRVAAALLVGLSITVLGTKILEISNLNRQVAGLDQAIEQAIHYVFPEVGEIRDARALFESKLRSLGRKNPQAAGGGFLGTLDHVAGAIGKQNGTLATIESINYRSGIMELRVVAPDVDSLDKIRESISKESGLQAEIQSANPDGDQVQGRLQIKPAGA
ncbi:MAG TPA: type II secretion system protein GspL [Gammaproteobacteria bacterium]|jgi:general secretion pathway protein L|nr:type II secretion system protein GspL [Gammaproteobacteria bacterium]HJP39880.1 type II secretion system protein GspL [Gammaproteobacteria bacterium]